MTALEALLYRIGREQLANDRNAVDGFGCSHEEAESMNSLRRAGWLFPPRRTELHDGVIFHRVALTKAGVREWTRLHRMRDNPSES